MICLSRFHGPMRRLECNHLCSLEESAQESVRELAAAQGRCTNEEPKCPGHHPSTSLSSSSHTSTLRLFMLFSILLHGKPDQEYRLKPHLSSAKAVGLFTVPLRLLLANSPSDCDAKNPLDCSTSPPMKEESLSRSQQLACYRKYRHYGGGIWNWRRWFGMEGNRACKRLSNLQFYLFAESIPCIGPCISVLSLLLYIIAEACQACMTDSSVSEGGRLTD